MLNSPLPPEMLVRCRDNRKNATSAERRLWLFLRNGQLGGYKFRRQHIYKGYILDFFCHEALLAIELDGSGHLAESEIRYERERSAALALCGVQVLQFWNYEVFDQIETVLGVIWEAVQGKG